MQILNSKAYYLKNYVIKSRAKSDIKQRHMTQEKKTDKLGELMHISNIKRRSSINWGGPHSISSLNSNYSMINNQETMFGAKDGRSIVEKQKEILKRVVEKNKALTKRRKTVGADCDYVVLQRHPLADINSIEFEALKPTAKYFKMMDNIRIAEKLLLAQPAREYSKKSLKKFYTQQNEYKANITKLSLNKAQSRLSRRKMLNRQKWID